MAGFKRRMYQIPIVGITGSNAKTMVKEWLWHEAFLRKIPEMTKEEAEMALYGVLGRGRESVHVTSSPLGAFGLLSSGVRLPMQMYRTGPIVAALEKQAGRNYTDKAMADLVRGTTARTIGAESGTP